MGVLKGACRCLVILLFDIHSRREAREGNLYQMCVCVGEMGGRAEKASDAPLLGGTSRLFRFFCCFIFLPPFLDIAFFSFFFRLYTSLISLFFFF
jgi:hypothetical protein